MTFEELKQKYAERDKAFPEDLPKPNADDLAFLMHHYQVTFPPSFIDFQLKECHTVSMGDVAFDGFGWANRTLDSYMNLEEVLKDYKISGFPGFLIPFRQDNGDFWCFDSRASEEEYPVVVWDHSGDELETHSDYLWKNFLDWLDRTMEEEY